MCDEGNRAAEAMKEQIILAPFVVGETSEGNCSG